MCLPCDPHMVHLCSHVKQIYVSISHEKSGLWSFHRGNLHVLLIRGLNEHRAASISAIIKLCYPVPNENI